MRIKNTIELLVTLLVLFALATFVSCQKEAQAPATSNSAVVVDSVASEDGLMVYYDVRGSGEKTIVFVHGWCCDRTYWKNQVEEFAKKYRVVTIDLGGHGQSGLEREVWTMAAFGTDVAAVVEKLDLNDIILVGHSMGGPVIIEAARRLPGRIVALIGVDNFHVLGQGNSQQQVENFVARFRPDFATATDQFVRGMIPEETDSNLVNWITRDMASAPPEVALSAIGQTIAYDYHSPLAEIRLPIRTISSDRYPTDVEGNRAIAASFEDRKSVV